MAKYIDAEKLKAEIEARKKVHFEDYHIKKSGNPADYGAANALTQLLPVIDSLQQEQPEVLSGEDIMTMCNQILIDWVKEGKTQEEKEQREQAHMRFFELYDNYLTQEQPEVDLEKETNNWLDSGPYTVRETARHFYELGLKAKEGSK